MTRRIRLGLSVGIPLAAAAVLAGSSIHPSRRAEVTAPPSRRVPPAADLPARGPFAGTGAPDAPRGAMPGPAAEGFSPVLDPEQILALNHLGEELERGGGRINRALDPLRAWARQDPAACAQWVMDNLPGNARQRCLEEAVAVWARQGPPRAVLDWLETQEKLHPEALTGGAYTLALSEFATQDGGGAARWLESHPAHSSVANWEGVFDGWIAQAPADAQRWIVAGHLSSELRDALAPNLLATFHDPAATALLLDAIGAPGRDDTLSRAARAASLSDPPFAMDLAAKISDPALRASVLDRTATRWQEIDPVATNTYATAHGLPLPAGGGTAPSALREQPLATIDPGAPPEPPR